MGFADKRSYLLRGGTVYDGTGLAGRLADVLIENGRIIEIRRGIDCSDAIVKDVGELAISPGFIDAHSHLDFTLEFDATARGLLAQGVTTAVVGNCGFSPWPICGDEDPEFGAFFCGGMKRTTWNSFEAFKTFHLDRGMGINLACLLGHGAARLSAQLSGRPNSSEDLDSFTEVIDRALAAGAVGLSLGLFYPHGRAASAEELVKAAAIVSQHDACLSVHVRDERDALGQAISEVIDIAVRTGVRLQVSHLKAMGSQNWGSIKASALDPLVEASEAHSLDIAVDVYPYSYGATSLSSVLPPWVTEGGSDELLSRMGDPVARERAADEIGNDHGRFKLDEVVLSSLPSTVGDLEGCSLLEAGQKKRRNPADLLIDLVERSSDKATMLVMSMDATDVERVIASPLSVIGSDGWETSPNAGSHPRNFETFPYFIGEFVRRRDLLSLEEAIAKCTSRTASRFMIERGRLYEGAVADVAVFDPSTIDGRRSASGGSQDEPMGPEGVEMVFVGGCLEIESGEMCDPASGMFLNGRR